MASNIESILESIESIIESIDDCDDEFLTFKTINKINKKVDEFPTLDTLNKKVCNKKQETLAWINLPIGIFYACKRSQYGEAKILTMKNRIGETVKVWDCSRLIEEIDELKGAYDKSNWKKIGLNQVYNFYDLVRI